MKEFYVWTKQKPFYRGPYELSEAIGLVKESAYIPERQIKLIEQEYLEGSCYNWHFVYGFNDLAHITVNKP